MPQATPRGTFLEIAKSLRQEIEDGRITERLPSKSELEKRHGVTGSTVDRVIRHLKAEGVVETVPGQGTFVAGTGDRRPLDVRMRDLLRSGGYAVGDEFPTLGQLGDKFGKSTITVRSAVKQLEGEGLIAFERRRWVVRALPLPEGEQDA